MKAKSYEVRVSVRKPIPEGTTLRKLHGYSVGETIRRTEVPGLGIVDRAFTVYSDVLMGPSPVYSSDVLDECALEGYRVGIYASTEKEPDFYTLRGFLSKEKVPFHKWEANIPKFQMDTGMGRPVDED
jgi:hypothetical protein